MPRPIPQLVDRHRAVETLTAAGVRSSLRSLDRWTATGRIPSYKIGQQRLYAVDDLRQFIVNAREQAMAP